MNSCCTHKHGMRLFCYALVVAMVLTLCPLEFFTSNAKADGSVVDSISIINADVSPVIGDRVGNHLAFSLPSGANYHAVSGDYPDWWCDTDGTFVEASDYFEAGKQYSRGWHFSPNDGCTFASDVSFVINGGSVRVNDSETMFEADQWHVWTEPIDAVQGSGGQTDDTIEILEVLNADIYPIIGETPSQHMAYDLPSDAHYTNVETMPVWWCDTTDTIMQADSVFEAGKQYSRGWHFTPDAGYYFADNMEYTINGSSSNISQEFTLLDDGIWHIWTISLDALTEMPTVDNITSVAVNNVDFSPVVGDTASQHMNFNLPTGAHYSSTESVWYCNTDNRVMAGSDLFEDGKLYSRGWVFAPESGYAFTSSMTFSINGGAIGYDPANTHYENANRCILRTNTVEASANTIEIDRIEIRNADYSPIVGDTASEHLAYDLPAGVHYTVSSCSWYNTTTNVSLGNSDTFVAENMYSRVWLLVPAEGYSFADELEIVINDLAIEFDPDSTNFDSDSCDIMTMPVLAIEPEVEMITEIEILHADLQPVINVTAGEHIFYEIPENANYTVTSCYWYCVTDSIAMNGDDLFQPNTEYALAWVIEANEGYAFADDATITINGDVAFVNADSVVIDGMTAEFRATTVMTGDDILMGDVNGDGVVNTGDAVIILKYCVDLVELDEAHQRVADFNGDGHINTGDAVSLLIFCVEQ